MTQQNMKLGNIAIVEAGENGVTGQGSGENQLDLKDPALQPPRQTDLTKQKTWKRKLIVWLVILLLIAAGVVALYLLMRVRRVNVIVNAETPRNVQNAKPRNEPANAENNLTADAINIVRNNAGLDAKSQSGASSGSSGPFPKPSPGSTQIGKTDFTGESPVFGPIGNGGSDGSTNPQTNTSGQTKTAGSAVVEAQSHANTTQSLFVTEEIPKSSPTPFQTSREFKPIASAASKPSSPTRPPFGTMLPVRTQGVIFTLRNNSYARLELTRDMAGSGWSLPKGTVLIGRTTGSEHDRAFISVIGYIDPRENKLVSLTGDVLGADGANGIPGKRLSVDRNGFKQALRKVASGGLQAASTVAGALAGRGTVVIDGGGYRLLDPVRDEARGLAGSSEKSAFVKVEAGQHAYVVVVDLPNRVEGADAPGQQLTGAPQAPTLSLTDREVMELILLGTAEEVRAAMPLMTEEQRQLAIRAQSQQKERP